jgi:molybdopterin synthase catalytic subunit
MPIVAPVVRIQAENFDIQTEIDLMVQDRPDIGAIVTFSGLCRDEDGTLAALELEHYPGMAEAEINRIARKACERWPVTHLLVVHRFGKITPGSNIVLVIATSPHREAAFCAASYAMDFLKTRAPFWKKEHRNDSTSGEWISAKERDDEALQKWD